MNHQTSWYKAILTVLLLACLSVLTACTRPQAAGESASAKPTTAPSAEAQPTATRRYPLTGRVVSVDKPNQSINIDGDEIPGFMSAMQMPYPVKDVTQFDKLVPGSRIKAEIVIGNEGAYLEGIEVTDKLTARKPAE